MEVSACAVDLHDVVKVYKRKVRALDGIDMRVADGEVFGLLGPNGAGKTTLVKIIMSVVRPTRARGTVLGAALGSRRSLEKVGYLPEHHRFPRHLTGRQSLEFFAALSRVDRATRKRRAAELLETVGMSRWADARIGTYSKGMMQRVGLAQALVNDPQLVILDEPTDGVDPVGRREIRDVLLRMKAQGRTVFVNSHLLSELEMICDRVAILVAGRVVRQGTIDELAVTQQCYLLEAAGPGDLDAALRGILQSRLGMQWDDAAAKGRMPSGAWVEIDAGAVRIGTTDAAAIQPLIDALRAAGMVLRRITPRRPSLEDLFMEAVGGMAGGYEAGAAIDNGQTQRGEYRP